MTDTAPHTYQPAAITSEMVEALRTENAQLRQERDAWQGRFEAVDRAMGALQEDFEAAESALTALTTALEAMADMSGDQAESDSRLVAKESLTALRTGDGK